MTVWQRLGSEDELLARVPCDLPRHRVIVAAACVYDAPVTPTGNAITAANVSNGPAAQVAKAGGTLTTSMDQIGVATAISANPTFADRAVKIGGVFSVMLDPMVQWVEPERVAEAGESDVSAGGEVTVEPNASLGATEPFRRAEWV